MRCVSVVCVLGGGDLTFQIEIPKLTTDLDLCSSPSSLRYCSKNYNLLCNTLKRINIVCYVTSSTRAAAWKKDNGFLYLLSFPSLIESLKKVKQYKGFFLLATRNTYPNTLSKSMLEQLITLWDSLVIGLFKCTQFHLIGQQSGMSGNILIIGAIITVVLDLWTCTKKPHVHVWIWFISILFHCVNIIFNPQNETLRL